MKFLTILAWTIIAIIPIVLLVLIKRECRKDVKALKKGFKENEQLVQKWSEIGNDVNCIDCPVCMLDFVEKDDVVQLQCDKDHVFHKLCLLKTLKIVAIKTDQTSECPLCHEKTGIEK